MEPISVLVYGALGRMGKEIVVAVCRDPQLKLVGAVDLKATQKTLPLPDASGNVPLSTDLSSVLQVCRPQVLVDFTIAEASMSAARIAAEQGVNLVIGTSGISDDNLKEIDQLCTANKIGAIVAPNFTIGAAILMNMVKSAAKFFDYAEIIEMHHNEKVDAPSATALATAKTMIKSRGKPFSYAKTKRENLSGTRGGEVDGIAIHAVRLQGLVASQEVMFGGQGQTLTVRHDTIGRDCYMPGIIMAIKEVVKRQGLVYGLDTLLNLGEQ